MKINVDKKAVAFSIVVTAISTLVSVVLTVLTIWVSAPNGLVAQFISWSLPIAIGVPICVAYPVSYKVYIQTRLLKAANEKLSNLIRYDQLTGLLSRATFFAEVEQTQVQNSTKDFYNAVFFMDLDHFKKVNDQYGHAAGDAILRRFGTLTIEQMQEGELVGRLGGEEFAMFIPDCTPKQGEARANAIARSLENQTIVVDNVEINCTISIGVCVGSNQTNLDAMLSQADKSLYKAKQAGRNRVVSRKASRIAA